MAGMVVDALELPACDLQTLKLVIAALDKPIDDLYALWPIHVVDRVDPCGEVVHGRDPDGGAQREVRGDGPGGQRGPDLEGADHDLHHVQRGCRADERGRTHPRLEPARGLRLPADRRPPAQRRDPVHVGPPGGGQQHQGRPAPARVAQRTPAQRQ